MEYNPFQPSAVPYYDNDRFPLGFRRCGEFTISEADILHNYGRSLRALDTGERSPLTAEERHFIEVCQGKKPAQSEIEKVWLKYRSLLGAKKIVSAFGRSKISFSEEIIEDSDGDDDEGDDDL